MEYKVLPLRWQPAENASAHGEFCGYAATFGNVDRQGDIICRGAFTGALPRFLDEGIIAWQHQWHSPIGRPVEAREDEHGLWVRARLVDTPTAREARTLLREGVIQRLSIGFSVLAQEALDRHNLERYLRPGEEPTPRDLKRALHGGRALLEVELHEVSPVSIPANPRAAVAAAKNAGGEREAAGRAYGRFRELTLRWPAR